MGDPLDTRRDDRGTAQLVPGDRSSPEREVLDSAHRVLPIAQYGPVPVGDAEMIAAAAAMTSEHFTVTEVVADSDGHMLIRFSVPEEPGQFAVRVPLPSSRRLKPRLYAIPENVRDAAVMLRGFLDEEVATGAVHWAAIADRGRDRLFEITPYGFRHADPAEHRRLTKAAGPEGWWGWVQEDEDCGATPAVRERARLAALPFSYPEVGATAGRLPAGYHTMIVEQQVGTGRSWFDEAVHRLMSWDMHRRAGLLVDFADHDVTLNGVAVLGVRLGPWRLRAPVRVLDVIDTPSTAGFAYGTLPGHAECGEERFLVHLDPDGSVRAEIRAFSRPGRWFTRLGGPVARRVQTGTTRRYLKALTRSDRDDGDAR